MVSPNSINKNALMFQQYRGLTDVQPFVQKHICKTTDFLDDLSVLLLSQVFAVDPMTGLPRGDIAQFLSDKTNPEVKDFIQNTLMKKVDTQTVPFDERITDDDIFDSMPYQGEKRDDYVDRIKGMLQKRENLRRLSEHRKDLEKKLTDN